MARPPNRTRADLSKTGTLCDALEHGSCSLTCSVDLPRTAPRLHTTCTGRQAKRTDTTQSHLSFLETGLCLNADAPNKLFAGGLMDASKPLRASLMTRAAAHIPSPYCSRTTTGSYWSSDSSHLRHSALAWLICLRARSRAAITSLLQRVARGLLAELHALTRSLYLLDNITTHGPQATIAVRAETLA